MANVRYHIIMLDLDYEHMIIDIFQHFLLVLRGIHLGNIFTSIETIMTLILEESNGISLYLIILLLDSMRKISLCLVPIVLKLFLLQDYFQPHIHAIKYSTSEPKNFPYFLTMHYLENTIQKSFFK